MRMAIHWFRADLRLRDNTALHAACTEADTVVPIFIFDPIILKSPDTGAPITAFMLQMLEALKKDVAAAGGTLIFRQGSILEEMQSVFCESGADALFYNRDYEPYARKRDAAVEEWAKSAGIEVRSFKDGVVHEPQQILKDDGQPYGVFSAYAKKWRLRAVDSVLSEVKFRSRTKVRLPRSIELPTLAELGFTTALKLPPAGEKAALTQLERFAGEPVQHYGDRRDVPSVPGTSQLSPHIRMGAVSVRTILAAVRKQPSAQVETYVGELTWRDFYRQILWHHPHAATSAFKPKFQQLNWGNDKRLFEAWCSGRTGFPIVDAGMRQVNAMGWMHNRLRMITASFLCKDLHISWQWGERYFMQHLLDADLANNNGGWQWSASTGTDAQPWFRIFNPLAQARKFDPQGEFIHRWVPEIDSGDYPKPIIDHGAQRLETLELFRKV